MAMTVPIDKKDQAIYHTILADMHRLHALMLNMQTIESPEMAAGLREYFSRDQSLTLGRLSEWRGRRPEVYREASDAFANQIHQAEKTGP